MQTFKNKVVVITGAASGIGKSLAIAFAKAGSQLSLNDYDEKGLAKTVEEIKSLGEINIYTSVFDVSNQEAMNQFAEETNNTFGKIDVMINNAGVALGRVTGEHVQRKDFEWIMNINFWGMVNGTQAFLPFIKKQKEGALANVSSIFGIAGIAHQAAYCSSKFAIRGYTESVRMEGKLEFPQVTIHSIHPGGISTNIVKNSRWTETNVSEEEKAILTKNFEEQLVTSPEKAAEIIFNGIRKKKERIIVGTDAKIMDRIVRWFPSSYTKIFLRRIKNKLLKGT